MSLHPVLHDVTERICRRSRASRAAYLAGIDAMHQAGPNRSRLSCGNLAHGFAARLDAAPTDAALALAEELAEHSPDALLGSKTDFVRDGKPCEGV